MRKNKPAAAETPFPVAQTSHITYTGPGAAVYFEKRAIDGTDLVMQKGQPVEVGTVVSAEYAELLVASGKAKFVEATLAPASLEDSLDSSEAGAGNTDSSE